MERTKASLRIGYGNRVVSLLLTSIFVLFFFASAVYTYTRVSTPARAYAATSSNLNFQARLLGSNGSTVPDGLYNVEFNLYTVSTGGTTEWTETRTGANKVRVANGYLSVALGDVTAFPGTINWDQDHWLTMNIGGTGAPSWDGEMNPRLKLTAVPYAFQAKQAEKLLKLDGSNTGILDFLALTANRTINLPDQNGTLCIQGSADCVDVATTGTTATTSNNSGLEISSDGLRLLGGCTDAQFLKWNSVTAKWECASGSGTTIVVRESDGSPSVSTATLEFGPASASDDEFIITNEGGGVTRIRMGDTVLTTTNYTTSLDGTYVNVGESPTAGDITGSFMGGFTLGANTVDLGTDTVGNYVASIGTVTGLTLSSNSGEGSTPGISVNYGALANTAVQGNTQLTCASGAGDLSGGGTVITLGSGGTCANLIISESPVFSTSVTTPLIESSSGLTLNTVASGAADDIILQTAGTEKLRLLENGDIRFEKGTDDVTFTIASPPGAPAIYTFSGATGTVLTTANYTTNLDGTYVNTGESPAAGDISGSFSGGFTIGVNTVALGTDTVGDYIANLGTVAGLSLSGNSGEGSTPGLSVLYGSTASTAVQGNTQLTCASGTGNLTGGGTVITLGSGGTCAGITTNNAVEFTLVTTPTLSSTGALTISSAGASNAISLESGSGTINVGAGTIATTAGLTFDTVNASNTTFVISNTGAGVANLNLADGGLQLAGTSVLSNGRTLSNITGLSSSGTVSLSSLNGGGLVKAAATSGDLSLAVAGTDYESPLTFNNGLTRTANTVKLGGNLTGATSIGLNSNTLSITGSGTAAINAASGGGLEILSDTTAALAVRNSAGSVTYFNVDVSGKIVQIGSSTANANATLLVLNSFNGANDPTGVNGASYYSTVKNKARCYENSIWKDCITSSAKGIFEDITPAAFAGDNQLTELFNDATRPNIVTKFTTSSVLINVHVSGVSNTANDAFLASRVVFTANGLDPLCATATQAGRSMIAGFTTATTHPYQMSGSFVHTPGVAGTIKYTICSSDDASGTTLTDAPDNVTISLVEIN